MTLTVDHLVLAARTLDAGLAWCEATLGLCPEAGGRHVAMGTRNRIFSVASGRFARAYFEIIAIDPDLPAPAHRRWFDLDSVALQHAIAVEPQLVHWVARCDDIAAARAELLAGGVDVGPSQHAERATPHGTLRWQISVRSDGRRPLGGAAPALIQWGDAHPTDTLAESGVALEAMRVGDWPAALAALLPAAIASDPAPDAAPISVRLSSPRGPVELQAVQLKG